METLMHCIYKIKTPNGDLVQQEPIVGRWYCRFETVGFDGQEKRERDGTIAQYEGDGIFVDEDGEDVDMGEDLDSLFPSYLVLQD